MAETPYPDLRVRDQLRAGRHEGGARLTPISRTAALEALNSWSIYDLRGELSPHPFDGTLDDADVATLAAWFTRTETPDKVVLARLQERLATEHNPDEDGPLDDEWIHTAYLRQAEARCP